MLKVKSFFHQSTIFFKYSLTDERLVLRHRRPLSDPFPNAYSHLLPVFSYNRAAQEISVTFASDPSYPVLDSNSSNAWMSKSYIWSSIPMPRPRTIIDDASAFIVSAITTPFSFIGGKASKPTPEEVFDGEIDLKDSEVLEQERGEEGEVDDSPERFRKVRVLALVSKDENLGKQANLRRKWEVLSIRTNAHKA
jgi:hypothetical protein